MQTTRKPNIEFIMQRLRKGIENSPLTADSLVINWMGPARKNFDIPNDVEKMLNTNVISGKAEFKSCGSDIVSPPSFFGKNPSVANNIDREMLTYNDNMIWMKLKLNSIVYKT